MYVNLHVPKTQYQQFDRMRQKMLPTLDPMSMMKQMQMMMGAIPGQQPPMLPFMMPMNPAMMPTARGGRNLPPKGFMNFQKPYGAPPKKPEPKKQFANV